MSKLLAVVVFVMLVLAGAMGLKNIVTAHGDGPVMMASVPGPAPPSPWKSGAGPAPTSPWK